MENIKNNLTIIIPCKNEENYIGNLLNDAKTPIPLG
jgi:glycosyltransferase involved in cell wall biosynthesis